MYKILLLALLAMSLEAKNIYIVTDVSNGITRPIYNELGNLTQPSKNVENDLYHKGDNVVLTAFRANGSVSKEFTYYPRNKKESAWKKSRKEHASFFNALKKAGVKKRAPIRSNIIFLVDTSGSMKQGDVIGEVQNTMTYLINAKSKKSKVAIVTFDGKQNMKPSNRSRVTQNFTVNKSELLDSVSTLKVSRYDTFLGSGLQKVQRLLGEVNSKNTLVLIFTDGKEINDHKEALKLTKRFKQQKINMKVVAVGGADIEMLKKFSTTGYIFNATSNDLKDMMQGISLNNDPLFLQLNSILENNKPLKPGDTLILYSSMMNVDSSSDFYIIPNLGSSIFYNELKKINQDRGVVMSLEGVNVYVRVTGEMDAEKVNQLKLFYKRFFKDQGANLRFFTNSNLTKAKF